jgi:3-deoxy-manno-octulosonate cytidylyltransferase (CMP-KDO synthetase)
MKAIGIIPARLQSSRLPRKLLLSDTGKPLLQYSWEVAKQSKELSDVIIAADGDEIAAVARGFGARVELTGEHPSGSDRIAEVVQRCCGDADVVVNIQGDEPELDPRTLNRLVQLLASRPKVEMATLACPIVDVATLLDTSCVKVVCAADQRALYFSRSPIPFYRDGRPEDLLNRGGEDEERAASAMPSPWLLHLGVYAYRREFLLAMTRMPRGRLEQLESLEQLRALEAGASILVQTVQHRSVGIDTAADYAAFVARQKRASQH